MYHAGSEKDGCCHCWPGDDRVPGWGAMTEMVIVVVVLVAWAQIVHHYHLWWLDIQTTSTHTYMVLKTHLFYLYKGSAARRRMFL